MLKEIVEASAADRAMLVRTLAEAFQEDPALGWILPDPEDRRKRLPRLFRVIVDGDLVRGKALRSKGGEAATLWLPPGAAEGGRFELVRQLVPMLHAFGWATGRAMRVGDAIEAHRPRDFPFWYLHFAGVRPEHQGKGWGGAAIRAGFSWAEAEGQPVYLETPKAANVPLYQRLGFAVTGEWDVPGGGPHFWSMLRRAGASPVAMPKAAPA